VEENSPYFFRPTWKGLWLIKFFSDVRYVVLEIYAIKVESCQKSRDFACFWSQHFWGERPRIFGLAL